MPQRQPCHHCDLRVAGYHHCDLRVAGCLNALILTVDQQLAAGGQLAVDNAIAKLYADGHIYQFKVPEPFGSVVSPLFAESVPMPAARMPAASGSD